MKQHLFFLSVLFSISLCAQDTAVFNDGVRIPWKLLESKGTQMAPFWIYGHGGFSDIEFNGEVGAGYYNGRVGVAEANWSFTSYGGQVWLFCHKWKQIKETGLKVGTKITSSSRVGDQAYYAGKEYYIPAQREKDKALALHLGYSVKNYLRVSGELPFSYHNLDYSLDSLVAKEICFGVSYVGVSHIKWAVFLNGRTILNDNNFFRISLDALYYPMRYTESRATFNSGGPPLSTNDLFSPYAFRLIVDGHIGFFAARINYGIIYKIGVLKSPFNAQATVFSPYYIIIGGGLYVGFGGKTYRKE